MIVLNQLSLNPVNIELDPTLTSPDWLFVFTFDDLNEPVISTFIVPTVETERYYTFSINTTANPMKTGEWVLRVYEMANTGSTDVTGLTPLYISKVRLYKTFAADNFHVPTLSDNRHDG